MNKKVFVGGPFNHESRNVMKQREQTIAEYCVKLFNNKEYPISALLMGLSFAKAVKFGELPTDTETWREFSKTMLKGCDEMHVLQIDGWEKSSGLKTEIEEALRLNIPVKDCLKYLIPNLL